MRKSYLFSPQIESEAVVSEETLKNATERMNELEKNLGDLMKKSTSNSESLDSIEKSVEDVKADADKVKKVCFIILNIYS